MDTEERWRPEQETGAGRKDAFGDSQAFHRKRESNLQPFPSVCKSQSGKPLGVSFHGGAAEPPSPVRLLQAHLADPPRRPTSHVEDMPQSGEGLLRGRTTSERGGSVQASIRDRVETQCSLML